MKCRQDDDAEPLALPVPLVLVPVLVPVELVPFEPLLLDSLVLDDPAPPALEVAPVGLPELLEDAEVDAEELGVDGLTLAGADAVGLCVLVGVGVGVGVGVALTQVAVPVTLGTVFLLFAALRLAVEFVDGGVAVLVAVAVAVAVLVGVAVFVVVLVGVPPLLAPPDGLVAEPAGVTLGVSDLLDLAWGAGDGEEVVGHAANEALPWPVLLVPGLTPPFDELARVPVPARLGVPLVLCEEIPATWPIWTRASRVGGSASATPMANTAAPTARAGRSSPSRQSRDGRVPSRPSRPVFRRRVRPARTPPAAPALTCLLARAGPAWTRARIRSRPSGCGSTWSAAACSARRRYSAKSCPCGGVPSWPGLVITPAPGRRGGRSCRAPCDF